MSGMRNKLRKIKTKRWRSKMMLIWCLWAQIRQSPIHQSYWIQSMASSVWWKVMMTCMVRWIILQAHLLVLTARAVSFTCKFVRKVRIAWSILHVMVLTFQLTNSNQNFLRAVVIFIHYSHCRQILYLIEKKWETLKIFSIQV